MSKNKSTITVLTSGVFDILHPGHVHYLTESRRHGQRLVVVVTSDAQAAREKRPPRHPAAERAKAVAALESVDDAFVGPEPYDLVGTVKKAGANVIALGHDQTFDETELAATLKSSGMDVAVVRCSELPGYQTTDLLDS